VGGRATQSRSVPDGKLLESAKGYEPMAYAPDGKFFAARPVHPFPLSRIYLPREVSRFQRQANLNFVPFDTVFFPDREEVMVVDSSGAITVLDTISREPLWQMGTDLRRARLFLARAPHKYLLVFGETPAGNHEGRLYNLDRKLLHRNLFGLTGPLEDVAYSPHAGLMVAACGPGKIWRVPVHDELMEKRDMRPLGFGFTDANQVWRAPGS